LLLFNSIAYGFGAINSFLLNKYWTFDHRQKITLTELGRFAVTTCLGILVNDLLIWVIGSMLHPLISTPTIWTNTSKILAIAGSVSISYLGMRLWVFTRKTEMRETIKEIGVHHLPRQGGRATGANLKVILRAFHDLFTYAWRWRRQELSDKQTIAIKEGTEKK
jgi:putative flippase GtrA